MFLIILLISPLCFKTHNYIRAEEIEYEKHSIETENIFQHVCLNNMAFIDSNKCEIGIFEEPHQHFQHATRNRITRDTSDCKDNYTIGINKRSVVVGLNEYESNCQISLNECEDLSTLKSVMFTMCYQMRVKNLKPNTCYNLTLQTLECHYEIGRIHTDATNYKVVVLDIEADNILLKVLSISEGEHCIYDLMLVEKNIKVRSEVEIDCYLLVIRNLNYSTYYNLSLKIKSMKQPLKIQFKTKDATLSLKVKSLGSNYVNIEPILNVAISDVTCSYEISNRHGKKLGEICNLNKCEGECVLNNIKNLCPSTKYEISVKTNIGLEDKISIATKEDVHSLELSEITHESVIMHIKGMVFDSNTCNPVVENMLITIHCRTGFCPAYCDNYKLKNLSHNTNYTIRIKGFSDCDLETEFTTAKSPLELKIGNKGKDWILLTPNIEAITINSKCAYVLQHKGKLIDLSCDVDPCSDDCSPINITKLCPGESYNITLLSDKLGAISIVATTSNEPAHITFENIKSTSSVMKFNNFIHHEDRCKYQVSQEEIIFLCQHQSCSAGCVDMKIESLQPNTTYSVKLRGYAKYCDLLFDFKTTELIINLLKDIVAKEWVKLKVEKNEEVHNLSCSYLMKTGNTEPYEPQCKGTTCSNDCSTITITGLCHNTDYEVTLITNLNITSTASFKTLKGEFSIGILNVDASSAKVAMTDFKESSKPCIINVSDFIITIPCDFHKCPKSCFEKQLSHLIPNSTYTIKVTGYAPCDIEKSFTTGNREIRLHSTGYGPDWIKISTNISEKIPVVKCNYFLNSSTIASVKVSCGKDECPDDCSPIKLTELCPNTTYNIFLQTSIGITQNISFQTQNISISLSSKVIDASSASIRLEGYNRILGNCNITVQGHEIIIPCQYQVCPYLCHSTRISGLTPSTKYTIKVTGYTYCDIVDYLFTMPRNVSFHSIETGKDFAYVWSNINETVPVVVCSYHIFTTGVHSFEAECNESKCSNDCLPVKITHLCPSTMYNITLITHEYSPQSIIVQTLEERAHIKISSVDASSAILELHEFSFQSSDCKVQIKESVIIVHCSLGSCPDKCHKYQLTNLSPEINYVVLLKGYQSCDIQTSFRTLKRIIRLHSLQIHQQWMTAWSNINESVPVVKCTYLTVDKNGATQDRICNQTKCSDDCSQINITNLCPDTQYRVTMRTSIDIEQFIDIRTQSYGYYIQTTALGYSSAQVALFNFSWHPGSCNVEIKSNQVIITCDEQSCPADCDSYSLQNLDHSTLYTVVVRGYIHCDIESTLITYPSSPTGIKYQVINETTSIFTWDKWTNALTNSTITFSIEEKESLFNNTVRCRPFHNISNLSQDENKFNLSIVMGGNEDHFTLDSLYEGVRYSVKLCRYITEIAFNCTEIELNLEVGDIIDIDVSIKNNLYQLLFSNTSLNNGVGRYFKIIIVEMLRGQVSNTTYNLLLTFDQFEKEVQELPGYLTAYVSDNFNSNDIHKIGLKYLVGNKNLYTDLWNMDFKQDIFYIGVVKVCVCNYLCGNSKVFPVLKTPASVLRILTPLILCLITFVMIALIIFKLQRKKAYEEWDWVTEILDTSHKCENKMTNYLVIDSPAIFSGNLRSNILEI